MSDALARARADLEAGRAWKARDRLTGLLSQRQDQEVLELLADAYYQGGDLPAAGALWSLTGTDHDEARVSIAAWHERYGNAEARWHSIPAPVRRAADSAELQRRRALAKRAQEIRWEQRLRQLERQGAVHRKPWTERVGDAVALACFLWGVALLGIGAWTVVQWIRH